MIHYQVRCDGGHEFDGWFKDSATFDRQVKRGQVECPVCGERKVTRALMAPALPRGASLPVLPAPTPGPGAPAGANHSDNPQTSPALQVSSGPQTASAAQHSPGPDKVVSSTKIPDQVRAMLQRMRAEIEGNCDYVGRGFADEARRIHRGETERRGIYGEASPEEAESLSEEGIPVSRIPWVDRAES